MIRSLVKDAIGAICLAVIFAGLLFLPLVLT